MNTLSEDLSTLRDVQRPKDGLTERQVEVLRCIQTWFESHEHSPSIPEIMEMSGMSSPGSMHKVLEQLEDRGHIRRRYRTPRSLVLT